MCSQHSVLSAHATNWRKSRNLNSALTYLTACHTKVMPFNIPSDPTKSHHRCFYLLSKRSHNWLGQPNMIVFLPVIFDPSKKKKQVPLPNTIQEKFTFTDEILTTLLSHSPCLTPWVQEELPEDDKVVRGSADGCCGIPNSGFAVYRQRKFSTALSGVSVARPFSGD